MRPIEIAIRLGIGACLALLASQAQAQAPLPAQIETPSPRPLPPPRTEIRVNSSFNMSEPVSMADRASIPDLQTTARKTIYEIAGKECKLLLDTIARECRIEALNVNSNVQSQNFRDPSTLFLNTTGNAVFRIVPKD